MTDTAIARADARLRDVRVAAFRAGWSEGRLTDLAPTLTRADIDTLCELIRCDIELRWAQRRPVALDYYRQRYPEVFASPGGAARLALEDNRCRTQAGERAVLAEYHQAYGVDVSNWPSPQELHAQAGDSDSFADSQAETGSATKHARCLQHRIRPGIHRVHRAGTVVPLVVPESRLRSKQATAF